MSKASEQEIGYFYRAILGREGSDKEIKAYLGQEYEAIVRDMISFTFFNGYDYATFRRNRDEDLRRAETDRDKWKSEAESAAKQPMSEGEAVRILKDLSNAFNAVANVTK